MRLDAVREALKRQVNSNETTLAIQSAHPRRPELRSFTDAPAIVTFLHDTDPRRTRVRSAVTRALLAETQARSHPCWSALLMVAYFPGLLRIRAALGARAGLGREDLDWIVVESFLEVASTLPLETQGRLAVVNLVLGTRKAVYQQVRSVTGRWGVEETLSPEVEDALPGPTLSPEALLLRREVEAALSPERVRAWLEDLCRDEQENDVLVVLGSYASGKPLIDYVREQYPDAGHDEFLRIYGCYRRRRSRLLARLRRKLADRSMSHASVIAALLQQEVRR